MQTNKLLKKEKGSIILMFILFLPFMMAFVGLAIDFGYVYVTRTKMQNTADAAALAGVVHLKDNKNTIAVSDYVRANLIGNDFTTIGTDPTQALSAEQNWTMDYIEVTTDKLGVETYREVTTPTEANRLRVNILKTIRLQFLPIVAPDLASIDLQTTAMAKGAVADVDVTFQIVTKGTLVLGSCIEGSINRPDSGDVHIPSYPASYKKEYPVDKKDPMDPQGYKDYGDLLNRNIYANNIDLKQLSTIRIAGKLISDVSKPDGVYMSRAENYLPLNNTESGCTPSDISTMLNESYAHGADIYNDAIRENNPIKAILIDLYDKNNPDKTSFVYTDHNILELRKKGKYATTDYFDTLKIKVPVIFYNSGKDKNNNPIKFTLSTNISFWHFTKELIVINGNLSISGSSAPNIADDPNKPPVFGESTLDMTTFTDVYCYDNIPSGTTAPPNSSTPSSYAGNFVINGGNAAPKDFYGVIYADSGVRINAAKDYRRHKFRNTILSPNDIIFGADHYSYNQKPVCYRFDQISIDTKIALVE